MSARRTWGVVLAALLLVGCAPVSPHEGAPTVPPTTGVASASDAAGTDDGQSARQGDATADVMRGVTLDSVDDLGAAERAIDALPFTATVRLVTDPERGPDDYQEAITALSSRARLVVQLVDSTAMAGLGVEEARSRARAFVERYAGQVEVWEVGNEVNGAWAGTGPQVLLEEGRKNERAEILAKLSKGMRLKGTVSSIVDFGAFVDLGGIDGLVHISELSLEPRQPSVRGRQGGRRGQGQVLDVDLQRERISLGLKQTTEDPWVKLVESYPVGTIVDGKVTKIVPFGAFIELGQSIEGLVHISEMAMRHIDTPAQVVKAGDEVKVKVMEINPERRRISLSMKAAAADLGFEIEVDESIQVEEKPAKKKADKPEAAAEVAEEAATEEAAE